LKSAKLRKLTQLLPAKTAKLLPQKVVVVACVATKLPLPKLLKLPQLKLPLLNNISDATANAPLSPLK
jgi:hypothetical protein